MIKIDGSYGEGGGQILRTSLALSLVTGQPFKIEKIRAGRKKSGLLRQHLTALNAAAEVGAADVSGAEIRSDSFTFAPKAVRSGEYHFSVGTAGSATLVLQTVLPALLTADGPTHLVLEGGTHNPYAPPFDFLVRSFLPILESMGPKVTAKLERPGFYPAGGGRFTVSIEPVKKLSKVDLMERGELVSQTGVVMLSQLPDNIGERELDVLKKALAWADEDMRVEVVRNPRGPGNIVMAVVESEHVTEVFTGFGERGVSSEKVAAAVIKPVREYLAAGVPVGRYLADQLMIPMVLAGGGEFMTLPLTRHSSTNIEIVKTFLDVDIAVTKIDRLKWHVKIAGK